jgi:hypothetical protein
MISFLSHLDGARVPDLAEANSQVIMAALAGEFPQYDFLYKCFHAQTDTPAIRFALGKGSRCRVLYNQPRRGLPFWMARAEAIVINFPSTALLHAVATNASLLVLVDKRYVTMAPEALEKLRRRATVSESLDGFEADLRAFLKRGGFDRAAPKDDSFLKAYCTHQGDGRSAQRVMDVLCSPPVPPSAGSTPIAGSRSGTEKGTVVV